MSNETCHVGVQRLQKVLAVVLEAGWFALADDIVRRSVLLWSMLVHVYGWVHLNLPRCAERSLAVTVRQLIMAHHWLSCSHVANWRRSSSRVLLSECLLRCKTKSLISLSHGLELSLKYFSSWRGIVLTLRSGGNQRALVLHGKLLLWPVLVDLRLLNKVLG